MSRCSFNLYIHIIRTYSYYSTVVDTCATVPWAHLYRLPRALRSIFDFIWIYTITAWCRLRMVDDGDFTVPGKSPAVMPPLWSKDGTDALGAVAFVVWKFQKAHHPQPSEETVDNTDSTPSEKFSARNERVRCPEAVALKTLRLCFVFPLCFQVCVVFPHSFSSKFSQMILYWLNNTQREEGTH